MQVFVSLSSLCPPLFGAINLGSSFTVHSERVAILDWCLVQDANILLIEIFPELSRISLIIVMLVLVETTEGFLSTCGGGSGPMIPSEGVDNKARSLL